MATTDGPELPTPQPGASPRGGPLQMPSGVVRHKDPAPQSPTPSADSKTAMSATETGNNPASAPAPTPTRAGFDRFAEAANNSRGYARMAMKGGQAAEDTSSYDHMRNDPNSGNGNYVGVSLTAPLTTSPKGVQFGKADTDIDAGATGRGAVPGAVLQGVGAAAATVAQPYVNQLAAKLGMPSPTPNM